MDNAALAMVFFFLTLILGIISWGIQIAVARRLKKSGLDTGPQIGKRSWIKPFRLGWDNAEELGIQDLMIIWSFLLGLTIIGVIGTGVLFALSS
jgi:hypothetical protein